MSQPDSKIDADSRLVILSSQDNVVVVATPLSRGDTVRLDGRVLDVASDIGMGHKMARRAIRLGEKILKYGVSIGSATRDISIGEHVHTHNVKSDYLPTYDRGGEKSYVQQH